MLKQSFKTTALIVRQGSAPHTEQILSICKTLNEFGNVLVHSLDGQFQCDDYAQVDFAQIGERADLAISIGGDGTLLTAARNLVDYGIPLVGINLGRLGFLADVTIDRLREHLTGIFEGNYSVEKRFLLDGEIEQQGRANTRHLAVNDIILHSHENVRMIEFDVFSDGQLINHQRADGLIISSPTGSTAYALSGGGPIMHPSLNALALVPICPHTLSQRPIVLPSDQCIEIKLRQADSLGLLSFDGLSRAVLECGDRIFVRRHEKNITLLHPAGYDYFHILRAKLNWSNQA